MIGNNIKLKIMIERGRLNNLKIYKVKVKTPAFIVANLINSIIIFSGLFLK